MDAVIEFQEDEISGDDQTVRPSEPLPRERDPFDGGNSSAALGPATGIMVAMFISAPIWAAAGGLLLAFR
jgi:hypothetical protein